ncbi:uncharacterized protein LOC131011243 [Salvia miltiorrhiza]|uniref:uncharacterized protein LOC131011243 n=1 Tax=Salvia miltiorrhiza TaxID=226208 RepID=UPI0025AD6647|nr:uncharacterized protein LOC131011243 [Salvia miltiorrhiza]
MEQPHPFPQVPSPCSSGRRSSCDTSSPEFEFWVVRNPSFPQSNLPSADELFSGGFLLPLPLSNEPPPPPQHTEATGPEPEPSSTEPAALTNSKRWRNLFKKDVSAREKREKKNGGAVGNVVSAAELNINIWPFSRSRSAGNGGPRPRQAAAVGRKASSAPCSRSNSAGESRSRKWAQSPSRAGVHLGRNSPVWQVRRGGGGGGRSAEALAEKGAKRDGNDGPRKIPAAPKTRVLSSLNVPMCIGYRNHLSCRHVESGAVGIAAAGCGGGSRIEGSVSAEVIRRSHLFNIRSLFTKKVH